MRISSLGNGLTMLERQYDVKDAEPKKHPSEAAIKESMRQRTLAELKKGNPAKWYELYRTGKLDTYGKDEDLIDEESDKDWKVASSGGSIGNKGPSPAGMLNLSEEEAKAKAKRMNAQLSPGEKSYYGVRYKAVRQ